MLVAYPITDSGGSPIKWFDKNVRQWTDNENGMSFRISFTSQRSRKLAYVNMQRVSQNSCWTRLFQQIIRVQRLYRQLITAGINYIMYEKIHKIKIH